MNVGEAFNILKPACNDVMRQPTKNNLLHLKGLVGRVSSSALETIFDVIVFPLEVYLENKGLGTEIRRYIVDCLREVIEHSRVTNIDKLFKLYRLVVFQIADLNKSNMVGDVPEELKLSVVQCITSLFRHTSPDVIQNELYYKKYTPVIGQGIYACLQLAQLEKLHSLRIAAIECVMTVAYVHEGADKDDIVLRHQVGDVLMFLLPGLAIGLHNTATKDELQGHQITVMAVKAWAEIISLIMDDRNNPPEPSEFFSEPVNTSPESGDENCPLGINWDKGDRAVLIRLLQEKARMPEWYRAAGEKLLGSVRVIAKVQRDIHYKARLELASACHLLLSKCCRNMKPCVMDLVEILIALTEDEDETVSETSKSALVMFSKKCQNEEGKMFLEMLEDNFYDLVTKLISILHGIDDVEQLTTLQLLAGYIKILGANKLPHVMMSAGHMNRLILALIHAAELKNVECLLEDYSLKGLDANYVYTRYVPWICYKHLFGCNVPEKFINVCHLLGLYGDLQTLTYHLLDIFHNTPQHRKEVILLLNEILIGGSRRYDVNLTPIVENVLDAYLEPSVWYVKITVDNENEEEEPAIKLKEALANVVQVCLLVEGVGKMAQVLGSGFDLFLLKSLYVVLERAGSSNRFIAAAGMKAAQDVAAACGHGNSVIDLVQANTDYFSFQVTTRLRSVIENPGVLDVLNVVMKYSKLSVLQYLGEIIEEALLHCSDAFQAHNAVSYLRVFYTFVASVRHWLENEENSSSSKPSASETNTFPKTLVKSQVVRDLLEYHRCKKQSEDFSEKDSVTQPEKESSDPDELEPEDENKKKKLPLHVTMTVSVLEKCVHFLPTKRKEQKLLVLSILQEGLLILETWEDELLPIAHTVWSPFVERFNETSEPLVVSRSFSLLCVLAKTAKDFIRERTSKQVLPILCQFLKKSASQSKMKDKGSAYRFSQVFKLQKELLSNMGDLVVHLKLLERELDQVLSAASPYLSNLQPLPLQEACVGLFKKLAAVDRDAVWLKVIYIWTPRAVFEPPSPDLKVIKIVQSISHIQTEYKKNVENILCFLDGN